MVKLTRDEPSHGNKPEADGWFLRLSVFVGEILNDILNVLHKPDGLKQLINMPDGSAEAEANGVLLLITVYKYLETTASWDALGPDIQKNAASVTHLIKQG